MTRHDLKEQLQHDKFSDSVANVVQFTTTNRRTVIRWTVIIAGLAVLIGAAIWYSAYRRQAREQDLEAAFEVVGAPVGQPTSSGKTFATEQAKRQASINALSSVANKDGASREGLVARYYLGTLKAQQDAKGAEADLKQVADSSCDCAPLAKIALAQLYAGQNRGSDAQQLLRSLVDKPSSLVSKEQAQVLLAQLEQTTNPQDAKRILQSLKTPNEDPVVARAADQLSADLTK